MNKGRVIVKLKPGGTVTAEQLADTVRRAGYTAKRVLLGDQIYTPSGDSRRPE